MTTFTRRSFLTQLSLGTVGAFALVRRDISDTSGCM